MQPQPSFQRHLTTCKVAKLRPGERHRTLDISDPKSLSFQSTSSSTRNASIILSKDVKLRQSNCFLWNSQRPRELQAAGTSPSAAGIDHLRQSTEVLVSTKVVIFELC